MRAGRVRTSVSGGPLPAAPTPYSVDYEVDGGGTETLNLEFTLPSHRGDCNHRTVKGGCIAARANPALGAAPCRIAKRGLRS